ncbi:MAG: hypothetical protein WCP24_02650 [bacterium]
MLEKNEQIVSGENIEKCLEKKEVIVSDKEKVTLFTDGLDRLSNHFNSFFATINTEITPSVLKDRLPESSIELKSFIKSLRDKIEESTAISDQYVKILQKTEKEINLFKLTSLADIPRLDPLMETATQADVSVRKNEAEKKSTIELLNLAQDKIIEAKLKETGFDSFKSVNDKQAEIRQEIRTLEGKYLGLGAVLNKGKINELTQEVDRLRDIPSYENQYKETYYDIHKYVLENKEKSIAESLITNIKNLSELAFVEFGSSKSESEPKISPALVEELNDSYLEESVRKQIELAIKESGEKGRLATERFGTKKQIDQALAILKESFDIERDNYRGEEQKEVLEKRERIGTGLEELPYSLRDIIRWRISGGVANNIWGEFNESTSNWKNEQYVASLRVNLESMRKSCSGTNSYSLSSVSYALEETNFPSIRKNDQINKVDVSKIDIERWKIFCSNKRVIGEFGQEIVDQHQAVIEDKIITSLHKQSGGREDFNLLNKLIELKSIKATPFIFLDAFRITGDGGGHHLISTDIYRLSSKSSLYKYVVTLSDPDIENLRQMNVPGLVEVIAIIKNNKDSFALKEINASQGEDDYKWIDNPVYMQITKELERMSCYYLENGTEDEKVFVLRTIKDLRQPLGAQANAIHEILSGSNKSFHLSGRAADALLSKFKYYNDFESLKLLCESSDIARDDMELVLRELSFGSNIKEKINAESLHGVDLVGGKLKLKISELMNGTDLKQKFLASVAACNLDLSLPVSSSDILTFFRSKDELKVLSNDNLVIDNIVNLAENIAFTDAESLEIAQIITSSEDLLKEAAYNWTNLKIMLGNKKLKINLELVVNEIEQKVINLIKGPDIKKKFMAYMIAENLKLPIQPSSSELVTFFRNIDDLYINNYYNNIFIYLVNFSKTVSFSDSEVSDITRTIAKIDRYYRLRQDDRKLLLEFINKLPTSEKFTTEEKHALLTSNEIPREMLKSEIKITDENWTTLLRLYVLLDEHSISLNEEERKKVKNIFSNKYPENRDFCLKKLHEIWQNFLNSMDNTIPIELGIISNAVRKTEGEVGDLKYISAIMNLINSVDALVEIRKTALRTKKEIIFGLKNQEKRIKENHLSEDDKAAFYNISNSIIAATPSLYTDFLNLFDAMDSKDVKKFAKEIYPLYQANLIVLEKGNEGSFSGRDLVPIRKRLEVMISEIKKEGSDVGSILVTERANLILAIQKTFEKRFGLLKIPENLTEEHIRILQNCVRYVGNIRGRDKTKEAEVSLFLGLNLNGEWENFRAGVEINLAEYFSGDYLRILEPILEKRKDQNKISPEIIGLSAEDTVRFQKSLQEETVSNTIGNVETIDIKLGNAKRNIEDLADPDIYTDEEDRETFILLKEQGKIVGSTLSKTYAETTGKKVNFSEEEINIRKRIEKIFKVDNWSSKRVKEIQDQIQGPNLICSVLRRLEEEKVEEVIKKLQAVVIPSNEIIEIFNSFGEGFKVSSGALALSQDLAYLENIIVKNENKISKEQRKMLSDYLGEILSQMSILEDVYSRIKEHFEKINKSVHVIKNEILKARLKEIERILYQNDEDVSLITRVTSNINLIIENMRQCLGCLSKEGNNDTNLTFGDYYKFYIMSQGEKQKGSISDEIVYFMPVKMESGEQEMSLIMDRVYGAKSSDILLAHIKAVVKKYFSLKKDFPEAKFSILVTENALSSAGFSTEQAIKKIGEFIGSINISHQSGVSVSIPESALGDNYTEFHSSDARHHGDATTSGLRLSV